MNNQRIFKRLEDLEKTADAPKFLWRNAGETKEDCLKRYNVADGAHITIIGWLI